MRGFLHGRFLDERDFFEALVFARQVDLPEQVGKVVSERLLLLLVCHQAVREARRQDIAFTKRLVDQGLPVRARSEPALHRFDHALGGEQQEIVLVSVGEAPARAGRNPPKL